MIRVIKTITLLSFSLLLCTCGDDDISLDEVLTIEGPNQVVGDGSSVSTFKVENTDVNFREIELVAEAGSFINASDNPLKITVTAERVNGLLFAEAQWKVPAQPGLVKITAEPNVSEIGGLFLASKSIMVDSSVVNTIILKASSFSVPVNFSGEITLTGELKNNMGKGVSLGTSVIIEDFLEDLVTPVGGRFRNLELSSDANSSVSAIYTPGNIEANQDIFFVATVQNQDGSKSGIADTLKIHLTQ